MMRAVLFVNGILPEPEAVQRQLVSTDLLIAVDGGTRHVLAMGLLPSVVIGDIDSLDDEIKNRLKDAGVPQISFDVDKNETDLELALFYALEKGCDPILIVAALGGRLDQTLANLFLVSGCSLRGVDIRLDDGLEEIFFIHDEKEHVIHGQPGDRVSLLPWGQAVEGIVTHGLKWNLNAENLLPQKTRGISNILPGGEASIRLSSGLLMVIHTRSSRSPEERTS